MELQKPDSANLTPREREIVAGYRNLANDKVLTASEMRMEAASRIKYAAECESQAAQYMAVVARINADADARVAQAVGA